MMDKKQALAEVDLVLANLPDLSDFAAFDGAGFAWLGRANAVLSEHLKSVERAELASFNKVIELDQSFAGGRRGGLSGLLRILHRVRHQLLLETGGSGVVAVDTGMHFQYFEYMKDVFQTATSDLLVVDAYLDAEVLSKFCVFVRADVSIRLLGWKYIETLRPAVVALCQQRGKVHLRKSPEVHDRYVFVDKARCIMSGASFKDGPKYAPSVLSELVDGVQVLREMYESKWDSAVVVV